jgi:alanine dehydrogenase
MIVGVPKAIKLQEHRVALLPSAVYQLCKRGHQVVVERSAGAGSGYRDADYESAGAELTSDHKAVFEKAEMIVKVNSLITRCRAWVQEFTSRE